MRPFTPTRPRAGFSLIELLVVITIMAIVIATLVSYLGPGGARARKAATATTIEKLDSMLKARWDEYRKDLDEQDRKKTRAEVQPAAKWKENYTNILGAADLLPTKYGGVYASMPLAARLSIVKLDRYRGTFPQREEDMYGLNGTYDGGTYVDDSPLLDYWRSTTPVWKDTPRNYSAHQKQTESSELLFLALSFGKGTGASKQVADEINPRHLKDSDADGIPEIYDDWGNMLRFYNAPTRLVRPGGTDTFPTAEEFSVAESLIAGLPRRPTSAAQAADMSNAFNQAPLDPRKGLHQFFGPPGARSATDVTNFEATFHTPDTFYKLLIVSCGEDDTLGLGEPTATGPDRLARPVGGDLTTAADNITNLMPLGVK